MQGQCSEAPRVWIRLLVTGTVIIFITWSTGPAENGHGRWWAWAWAWAWSETRVRVRPADDVRGLLTSDIEVLHAGSGLGCRWGILSVGMSEMLHMLVLGSSNLLISASQQHWHCVSTPYSRSSVSLAWFVSSSHCPERPKLPSLEEWVVSPFSSATRFLPKHF